MTKQMGITITKQGGVYTAYSIEEYALTLCARDWRGPCKQKTIAVMEIDEDDTERDKCIMLSATRKR